MSFDGGWEGSSGDADPRGWGLQEPPPEWTELLEDLVEERRDGLQEDL